MKYFYWIILVNLIASCDTPNRANGIVLDAETKEPVDSVSIGLYEKLDSTNAYSKRAYTNNEGKFEYKAFGLTSTFTLYFLKEGYRTKKDKRRSSTNIDTIYLKPI